MLSVMGLCSGMREPDSRGLEPSAGLRRQVLQHDFAARVGVPRKPRARVTSLASKHSVLAEQLLTAASSWLMAVRPVERQRHCQACMHAAGDVCHHVPGLRHRLSTRSNCSLMGACERVMLKATVSFMHSSMGVMAQLQCIQYNQRKGAVLDVDSAICVPRLDHVEASCAAVVLSLQAAGWPRADGSGCGVNGGRLGIDGGWNVCARIRMTVQLHHSTGMSGGASTSRVHFLKPEWARCGRAGAA